MITFSSQSALETRNGAELHKIERNRFHVYIGSFQFLELFSASLIIILISERDETLPIRLIAKCFKLQMNLGMEEREEASFRQFGGWNGKKSLSWRRAKSSLAWLAISGTLNEADFLADTLKLPRGFCVETLKFSGSNFCCCSSHFVVEETSLVSFKPRNSAPSETRKAANLTATPKSFSETFSLAISQTETSAC